ncbi:MAG: DNA repair protein RecO [Sandaracinaceae bacterium]
MPRSERTPAVLLRSVVYGETDRIVTLLTESHGKVGAIARGARASRRRFGAHLEPYSLIEAELVFGRGDLARLASARGVRVFPGILADLGRMTVAAAGLEVVRLAVADGDPPDARLLPTVVRLFELAEQSHEEVLRVAFVMRVLSLTGLAPGLERCGKCGRVAPAGRAAYFDPTLGSVVCRACGGAHLKLSGTLRRLLIAAQGRGWDDVATTALPAALSRVAAQTMDEFAVAHLGRRLAAGEAVGQVREMKRIYRAASNPEGPPENNP